MSVYTKVDLRERGEAEADKTVKMQKMKHLFFFVLKRKEKKIETVAVGGTAGRWCRARLQHQKQRTTDRQMSSIGSLAIGSRFIWSDPPSSLFFVFGPLAFVWLVKSGDLHLGRRCQLWCVCDCFWKWVCVWFLACPERLMARNFWRKPKSIDQSLSDSSAICPAPFVCISVVRGHTVDDGRRKMSRSTGTSTAKATRTAPSTLMTKPSAGNCGYWLVSVLRETNGRNPKAGPKKKSRQRSWRSIHRTTNHHACQVVRTQTQKWFFV